MSPEKKFGDYLKELRLEKGLGINQLATYSGVSSSQISRIEAGKRGAPKPENIKKLSDALKVPYKDLMQAAGYLVMPELTSEEKDFFERANGVESRNVENETNENYTKDELLILEEIKKHPVLFHDLKTNPEKKIKKLIKMWKFINEDLEDDDPEDGFGELDD